MRPFLSENQRTTRFWDRVLLDDGCWLWQGARDNDGYGNYHWPGMPRGAHRISYTLFNGPIPGDMHVCHACDVPGCVNPSHLFLGTHLQSMQDRDRKGRGRPGIGEKNGRAILRATQVEAIRRGYATGMSPQLLADIAGVSYQHIWRIINHRCWTHVPE